MTRPALIAAVPLALLAACGVAWAQEVPPALSGGLGAAGTGASAGLIVAVGDRLLRYLADRDAKLQAKEDQAKDAAAWASVASDINRIRDQHNTLAGQVGRLEERQAMQAAQVHSDLARIGGTLDDIRDRLPPRP